MMADGLSGGELVGFFWGLGPVGGGYPVRQMENAKKRVKRMKEKRIFGLQRQTDRE